MTQFEATIKAEGRTRTLVRKAESRRALLASLRAEGLTPVRVEEMREDEEAGLTGLFKLTGRRPRRAQMQAFMSHFATLLRSGMDLARALNTLQSETSPGPLRVAIGALAEHVRQGESLSAAMARVGIFTPFQLNIVRAGEYGGALPQALARIAQSIERDMEMRSRIRNAVAYPAFLICFGLASMAVMMLFILPKFLRIYDEMHARLPMMTALLLRTSSLARAYGPWLIPLAAILGVAAFRYVTRFRENPAADRVRMRLPLIGPIVREVEVGRFLRTMGTLLQSGIPATQSLRICSEITGSAIFAAAAAAIEKGVQTGGRISAEMRRQGLFSESVVNLVAVGEESGELDGLLLETAETIEKRVDELVKVMLTFLEPLLILVVGVIIGVIVMSMLLPIFSLSAGLRAGN